MAMASSLLALAESMRDHLIDHVWPVLDEEAREGGAEGMNQKGLAAAQGIKANDDAQA